MIGRFIKTTNKESSTSLSNLGLVLISERRGVWTFINNPEIDIAKYELKDVIFSNKLEV